MNSSSVSPLAVPYDNPEQQREAAMLGMWIFLGTEVLFFGGLFVGYAIYRYSYPEVFREGAAHLSMMTGAIMTAVLLTGSLLVTLSNLQIRSQNPLKSAVVWKLAITTILGATFLALEFHEYGELIGEGLFPGKNFHAAQAGEQSGSRIANGRQLELFFCLFFFMTGLHAFHMIIGVLLVAGLTIAIHRAEHATRHRNLLENVGLYWHFVDIVWVFLFPLFYLVEGQ